MRARACTRVTLATMPTVLHFVRLFFALLNATKRKHPLPVFIMLHCPSVLLFLTTSLASLASVSDSVDSRSSSSNLLIKLLESTNCVLIRHVKLVEYLLVASFNVQRGASSSSDVSVQMLWPIWRNYFWIE